MVLNVYIKHMSIKTLTISFILILTTLISFAEGTKEISPNSNNQTYFMLRDATSYSNFARYNSLPTERLNFTICNTGEKAFFGMRKETSENNTTIKFRVKRASDGVVVFTERDVPTTGTGYISTYNQAVAGPQQITGTTGGYNAYTLTGLTPGDYFIEFNTTDIDFNFRYLDITVASATNQALLGRVWSQEWLMNTRSFNNPYEGTMYIYADDGIVTSVDFNGIRPYVFNISANPTGVKTTGNFNEDRQSVGGRQTYPQYKIFLNPPDPACYPSGQFGKVTGDITITGCGLDKCINVPVDQAGRVLILLDLNGQPGYQPNSRDVQFNVFVKVGNNCIPWDTRDNFGDLIPEGQNIDMQIDYLNGITHLPMFDVESHPNGYTVGLVRPLDPDVPLKPRLFWDDVSITSQGGVNGTTELTGCQNPACHTWLYTTPNYDNNRPDYGNLNTINTWWYANIITEVAGYVVKNAEVDADTRLPGRGADGGNDTTICSNSGSFQLAGNVAYAPSGTWSTSGTGTFSNINDFNGTYTPSPTDFTNGSVVLTLKSDSTDECPSDQDFLRLQLDPGPVLTLNPGDTLCENNSNISLSGSFTNADGIRWVGGNGTFVPNRRNTTPTYNPTQAEIDSGYVMFIFRTNNVTNVCPNESDTVEYYFQKAPIVTLSALADTICENTPFIQLSGTVQNAGGSRWLGGNGTFNPSRDSINTQYTPTTAERNSGRVVLTLSSRLETNGCTPVSESITFNFISPSSISITAPTIQTCASADTVYLTSNISGNPKIKWSGGNGTFLPNDSMPNPKYVVTAADTTAKNITLSVTTDGSDGCSLVNDDVIVQFTSPPTAQVTTPSTLVCANNPRVTLGGTFTNSTGIRWVGNGGTFSPSSDSLNATYLPSQAEINANVTFVTLTTIGNGFCAPATSVVNVVIAPSPTAEANGPYTICANNPTVQLNGVAQNSTLSFWTGGKGTFGDSTLANTTYTASPAEITSATTITLNYVGTQNPICLNVQDPTTINFTPTPIVDAGPPQSICANNAVAQLNASFSGATQVTWSGGTASGFSNINSISSTYRPTIAEIASGTVKLFLTTSAGIGSCNNVTDSVIITITPAPIVDAGNPQSVCANNDRITLTGTIQNATGGTWSGGENNFAPNATRLTNVRYNPSANEGNNGGLMVYLTSTGNGNCLPVTDSVFITITPRPVISDVTNQRVCADAPNVTYTPNITVATGGIWSGGNGTYSPDNATLNMTYTPSQSEIDNGSTRLTLTTTNNGTCNDISLSRNITIDPAPIINAGTNQTICGSVSTVQLNGIVQNANGGRWTSLNGGTFSNRTDLNAIFTPTAQNKLDGEVTLVLETTGNGRCNAISDTLIITFTEIPLAEAGNNRTICSSEFPIQLNASGSAGSWTGGTGTFTPDRNTLNAIYTPTAGEVTATTVQLTWQTNVNGSCPQVSDNVTYTLQEGANVVANTDQILCGNTTSVNIGATVTNATNAFWTTTGTGQFTPSNATGSAITYAPSQADTSLTDTTTTTFFVATIGNQGCPPSTDSLTIRFVPAPIIAANANETLCADGSAITLNGSSLNTSAVLWTGGNGGTFNPATNASTTYTPNATDLTQTTLTFILSSTASTNCGVITDTTIITLEQGPTTEIGPNHAICGDSLFLPLTATTTGATTGLWTSTGTGTFSPNATALTTDFYPSVDDTATGQVTIYFTTAGTGICTDITDSLTLTITPSPQLVSGNDTILCSDSDPIALNGIDNGVASSLTWSTSGDGNFSAINDPNATYTLSANDISNTVVALTLSSNGSGNCKETSHTFNISLSPIPTISAGLPQTICIIDTLVSVTASVTNATGVTWSTLSNGTFTNDSALTTTYRITATDTAAKQVTLIATTSGTGLCKQYSDTVIISLQTLPIVDAGPIQQICGDAGSVALTGTVSGASGSTWSTSSTGLFSPNSTSLSASYSITTADTTKGNITFYLKSTDSGVCPDQTDSTLITITDVPQVFAGNDTIVCANIDSIAIGGNVITAGGGKWLSSGTGTFTPNDSTLNAFYKPSANDTASGQVTITLSTTGNGTCNPVRDDFRITFTKAPRINAGPNMTICADSSGVKLRPVIQNVSSVVWRTSGSGVFGADTTVFSPTYYPSETDTALGQVTLTVIAKGNTGCASVSATTVVNITPEPTLSLSNNVVICHESGMASANAIITNTNGGQWSSATTGNFSPSSFDSAIDFFPSSTDTAIYLTYTTEPNGVCKPIKDSVLVTVLPEPSVFAGDDITFCGDVEFFSLTGTVTNALGGVWSTSGTGSILPNDSSLIITYAPSNDDRLQDSIVFSLTTTDTTGCAGASDQKIVYFTPIPTINAGSNISTCPGIASIPLNGTVTIATGGVWEDLSGTGTFTDSSNTNTTYFPDPAEAVDGNSITLKLYTTGAGNCASYTEDIVISFTNTFSINAGPQDTTICNTDFPIQLNGSGAQGVWSGGAGGTFLPNPQTMDAVYKPSTTDSTNGSVKLYLTTSNVGTCTPAIDSVNITFINGPAVNAGNDFIVCTNETQIVLSGTRSNTISTVWTSSGKGTFDNILRLDPIYTISAQDKTVGFVNFTLTSLANGTCSTPSDKVQVILKPGPTVNPGSGATFCSNVTEIPLSGSIINANGATWSGGSNNFIASATSLNARYQVQSADTTAGFVVLTLTSQGHPNCNAAVRTVRFNFDKLPTAEAGNPLTICANNESVRLEGVSSNALSRKWSITGGDGLFSPLAQKDTVDYFLGTTDVAKPSLKFYFTSQTNNNCPSTRDSVTVTITPAPIVDATPLTEACENAPFVQLTGSVLNTSLFQWFTTGNGSLSPDNTSLPTTYLPDSLDMVKGAVNFELRSTDPSCNAVSDFITLNFVDLPIAQVNAGVDIAVCDDTKEIPLQGTISSAKSGKWSTNGTGVFLPNDSTLIAKYIPTTADTAAGTIQIRLTAKGNTECGEITDSITVTFTDSPKANLGGNITVCADTTNIPLTAQLTVANGVRWSTSGTGQFSPNRFVTNANYIPTASDIATGIITLSVLTTGNGTCNAISEAIKLSFTTKPSISAGNDQILCETTTGVQLTGITTVATAGIWSTSSNGTFTNGSSKQATYIPSANDKNNGLVVLTFTTTDHGQCKPVNDQVSVRFDKAPTVFAGNDITICEDNTTVQLSGSANNHTSVTWKTLGSGQFSSTSATSTIYNLSSTDQQASTIDLQITATGSSRCPSVSDIVQLQLIDSPAVDAEAGTLCEISLGTTISGTIQNAQGGIWSTAGTGSFSPSKVVLNGSYFPSLVDAQNDEIDLTLTSTGNGLCQSVSANAIVTILPLPTANAGTDITTCRGSNVTLSAKVEDNIKYEWQTSGGATVSNTSTFTFNATTDSIFILIASRPDGCSTSDQIQVRVFDLPNLTITPQICFSDTLMITATVTNMPSVPGSFQWYRNGIILQNEKNTDHIVQNSGTFRIEYSYGNCKESTSTEVTPLPKLDSENEIGCRFDSVTVQTTAITGASYTWSYNAINVATGNPAKVATPLDSAFVKVDVTNTLGCTKADSLKVYGVDRPIINLLDVIACDNDTVTLDATPTNASALTKYTLIYAWFKDNAKRSDITPIIKPIETGNYKATITIDQCVGVDSAAVGINISPIPTLPDRLKMCLFKKETLNLDPNTGTIFLWSTGDTTQTITISDTGTYSVLVTNEFNCSTTDTVSITDLCAPEIFMPTAFVPGTNNPDQLYNIFGHHFINFNMTIYNRWGEVIFFTDDPALPWDGYYKGDLMPVGVYPWKIQYQGMEEYSELKVIEGSVTVVR